MYVSVPWLSLLASNRVLTRTLCQWNPMFPKGRIARCVCAVHKGCTGTYPSRIVVHSSTNCNPCAHLCTLRGVKVQFRGLCGQRG